MVNEIAASTQVWNKYQNLVGYFWMQIFAESFTEKFQVFKQV